MKDLLSIRSEKNLTQRDMAKILNVSASQICRIESGECELSLAQYAALIKALSLSNEQASQLMQEALATAKPPRLRKSKAED